MKQLHLLLILFILTTTLSFGQSAKWIEANTYGPNKDVLTTKYTSDSNSNHYLVGTFKDEYIIGGYNLKTPSSAEQNGFVVKIDKNNKVQWAHSLSATLSSSLDDVAIDKNGNVVVTGEWYRDAIINGTKYSADSSDGVIIQYDSTGKINWVQTASGKYNQHGQKLYIDGLNNIYWGGRHRSTSKIAGINFSPSGNKNNAFLAKISSNGKTIRVNEYTPSSGIILGDITGTSDQIFLVGLFHGTLKFGNTTLGLSVGNDMFIAKMDTTFKVEWAKDFGGSVADHITCAHVNSSGVLGIGGYFDGSVNFGTTKISGGSKEMFVATLNSKGVVEFAKKINSNISNSQSYINDVYVDKYNSLTVSGNFMSGIKWSNKTYYSSGNFDVFVANFTNKGIENWILTAGSSNIDQTNGLCINTDGSFTTGGFHLPKAKFGNITLNPSIKSVFTARYYPPTDAPKFKKYPTQYVYVDSTFTTKLDLKLDFPPKYDIIKGPTKNFSFNKSTEQISFSPDNSQLGIDTIQIAATNPGGSDTLLMLIETITKPNISLLFPRNTCLGLKQAFNFNSPNSGPLKISWTINDIIKITDSTAFYTFIANGNFKIKLNVVNIFNDKDSALQTINVYDIPIADFDLSDSCHRSNTNLYFSKSNSTKDTITTYKWWVDGQQKGGNQATIQHSFATHSKNYLVKLYLETKTGCKDSIEKNIKLKEVIPAVFAVDATCIDSSSVLQHNFNASELDSLNWIGWGVTVSETNPNEWIVHFDTSSKHQLFIRTFAKNGCQDSSNKVLSAKELPNVDFNYTSLDNKRKYQFKAIDNSLKKYEWFFGDGKLATIQNVEYIYTNDGTYKATLIGTGSNGCIDSSSQNINVKIETISVNEHKLLGINVFPNPMSSHFTIQLPNNWEDTEPTEWTIYNVQGKAVLNGHLSDLNNNIDISQLANATYTLTIVQKNSTANYQIIKH